VNRIINSYCLKRGKRDRWRLEAIVGNFVILSIKLNKLTSVYQAKPIFCYRDLNR